MQTKLTVIRGVMHSGKTRTLIQSVLEFINTHKDALLEAGATRVLLTGMESPHYVDAEGEIRHFTVLGENLQTQGFYLSWAQGPVNRQSLVDTIAHFDDGDRLAVVGIDQLTDITVSLAEDIVEQAGISTFIVQCERLSTAVEKIEQPPLSVEEFTYGAEHRD